MADMRRPSGAGLVPVLAALLIVSLGACGRELGPLSAGASSVRPRPSWDVRGSNGDGSVAWVLESTLAALRHSAYTCYVTGGPLRGGKLVAHNHYSIGSDDTVTEIEILAVNGELFTRSVRYADRSGRRRTLHDSKDRPMVGADSVATRLFDAAAAATCPSPSNPPPIAIQDSEGDGSVEWVLDATLAALRDGTYGCVERVSPVRDGGMLGFRFYHVGSGATATLVSLTALDQERRRSIHYTDQMGRRRIVREGEGRPLAGADSVARRIFAAAAAAPCPTSN